MHIYEILLWGGLGIAALVNYVAISLGPYAAGKSAGKKKTVDDLVAFSVDDPADFDWWLGEQICLLEKQKQEAQDRLARLARLASTKNKALAAV